MKSLIFSADSVRAILRNDKTQTRRIVTPQPHPELHLVGPEWYEPVVVDRHGEEVPGDTVYGAYSEWTDWGVKCPLQPGDVVYVRETFGLPRSAWGMNPQMKIDIRYRADGERDDYLWRSPIHMPEWAARIHLEITGVRVERLQGITNEDATAEGVIVGCDSRDWFAEHWNAINARRGYPWESNPWVWAYEFRKVKS